MEMTAVGSVMILKRVASAASFSSASLRMLAAVKRLNTTLSASKDLLEASADMFCKDRKAETRDSGDVNLAATTSVPTRPPKRVSKLLFAGNRVKLQMISRHLECMGLSVSLETVTRARSKPLLEHNMCCGRTKKAMNG